MAEEYEDSPKAEQRSNYICPECNSPMDPKLTNCGTCHSWIPPTYWDKINGGMTDTSKTPEVKHSNPTDNTEPNVEIEEDPSEAKENQTNSTESPNLDIYNVPTEIIGSNFPCPDCGTILTSQTCDKCGSWIPPNMFAADRPTTTNQPPPVAKPTSSENSGKAPKAYTPKPKPKTQHHPTSSNNVQSVHTGAYGTNEALPMCGCGTVLQNGVKFCCVCGAKQGDTPMFTDAQPRGHLPSRGRGGDYKQHTSTPNPSPSTNEGSSRNKTYINPSIARAQEPVSRGRGTAGRGGHLGGQYEEPLPMCSCGTVLQVGVQFCCSCGKKQGSTPQYTDAQPRSRGRGTAPPIGRGRSTQGRGIPTQNSIPQTKLTDSSSNNIPCPDCGSALIPNNSTCNNCGSWIPPDMIPKLAAHRTEISKSSSNPISVESNGPKVKTHATATTGEDKEQPFRDPNVARILPPMCPLCAVVLIPNSKFCNQCGASL